MLWGGVVVYVGESENVFKRCGEHKDKPCDEVFYLLASESQRNMLEKGFIRRLNPKYNQTHKNEEGPREAQVVTPKTKGLPIRQREDLKKQIAAVAA